MKAILLVSILVAFSACSSTTPAPAPVAASAPAPASVATAPTVASADASLDAVARELVEKFAASDWAGTSAHFDATMRSALTADKLAQVRATIGSQLGGYSAIRSSRSATEGGYRIIYVRTGFANGDVDAKVVFNDRGEVAGLFFVPAAP